MIIGILIGLLVVGALVALVCYVTTFIVVELLKAPPTFGKVVWLIGLIIFIAYLVQATSPITHFALP